MYSKNKLICSIYNIYINYWTKYSSNSSAFPLKDIFNCPTWKKAKDRLSLLDDSELWEEILRLQTKLLITEEMDFLEKSEYWNSCNSVLEIGCGKGAYLKELALKFPNKKYLGIEILPDFANRAKENCKELKNIEIKQGDIYHFKSRKKFDVIILRLVLQHLDKIPEALKKVRKLLKPEGLVIIKEADDSSKKYSQKLIEVGNAYSQLKSSQKDTENANRSIGKSLRDYFKTQNKPVLGFSLNHVNSADNDFIPITKKNIPLLCLHHILVFEIAKRQYGLRINQKRLFHEISEFCIQKKAWARLGFIQFSLEAV